MIVYLSSHTTVSLYLDMQSVSCRCCHPFIPKLGRAALPVCISVDGVEKIIPPNQTFAILEFCGEKCEGDETFYYFRYGKMQNEAESPLSGLGPRFKSNLETDNCLQSLVSRFVVVHEGKKQEKMAERPPKWVRFRMKAYYK